MSSSSGAAAPSSAKTAKQARKARKAAKKQQLMQLMQQSSAPSSRKRPSAPPSRQPSAPPSRQPSAPSSRQSSAPSSRRSSNEQAQSASSFTHELAVTRIKPSHLFIMHNSYSPSNLLIKDLIGYYVEYIGECVVKNCGADDKCAPCGICVHQYICTCNQKRGTNWCSHIHAAVGCGNVNPFTRVNDYAVFYQRSTWIMQRMHERAMCIPHTYTVTMNRTQPHRVIGPLYAIGEDIVGGKIDSVVHVGSFTTKTETNAILRPCGKCPRYRICRACNICYHTIDCSCDEPWRRQTGQKVGPICEHRHYHAMMSKDKKKTTEATTAHSAHSAHSRKSKKVLPTPAIPAQAHFYAPCVDESDDEPDSYLQTVDEHHQRAQIISSHQLQPLENNVWLYFRSGPSASSSSSSAAYPEPEVKYRITLRHTIYKGECTCNDMSDRSRYCSYCGICAAHWECECKRGKEFCRHIHAVLYKIRSLTPMGQVYEVDYAVPIPELNAIERYIGKPNIIKRSKKAEPSTETQDKKDEIAKANAYPVETIGAPFMYKPLPEDEALKVKIRDDVNRFDANLVWKEIQRLALKEADEPSDESYEVQFTAESSV